MFLNLVRNNAFGAWVGGRPLNYSAQLTNTTEEQLDKTSPREHPARAVMAGMRNHELIGEGRFAYRAVIGAAGVADSWRIWSRADAGAAGAWGAPGANDAIYQAFPGKRYSLAVTARCSVDRNLLRVRVIAMNAAFGILYYLTTAGGWQVADAQTSFQLSPLWRTLGVDWEAPEDAVWFMWMFSNGTAGAQSIDLDRVWMPHPMWDQGGEEVV